MSEQDIEPEVAPEIVPPEVITPPEIKPLTQSITPLPNAYVEKYASKLKAEMGDKYSTKFDKMPVEQRIDAMEATLDVLGKPAIQTVGETNVPLGEKPPIDNKPKSFLKTWQSEGYEIKSSPYSKIAKSLYKRN